MLDRANDRQGNEALPCRLRAAETLLLPLRNGTESQLQAQSQREEGGEGKRKTFVAYTYVGADRWCLDEIRSDRREGNELNFFLARDSARSSALCFSLVRSALRNFVPTAMVNAFSPSSRIETGREREREREGERGRKSGGYSFLFSLRRRANDRPSRAVWMKPPPGG